METPPAAVNWKSLATGAADADCAQPALMTQTLNHDDQRNAELLI
ncbi:hypothetical protein Msil_0361 [Methylocella silvestris BL2]|uniref:Uncharacterized protein n=1 Tax=Methylocella silvestris (strain DSM 15510 / CIP 108128 / LMG 27833 / NCIMB 13906 / BL2) TaxID=395965 RepID=B8EQR8_METSB|nr:hypothetical protein Msil_0361 [Methylocella silvestris BL2]